MYDDSVIIYRRRHDPADDIPWELWLEINRVNTSMAAPDIESSTREERLNYVLNEWKCLHNCKLCGKCYILRGSSEEQLYADYIEGKRSYMDITLEIRNNR